MILSKVKVHGHSSGTGYHLDKDLQGKMHAHGITNPVRIRPNKRLFDIKEAALYLGRTVGALREMLYASKIPVVRDGRRILIDIYDMDAWIEKNKSHTEY